MHINKFCDIVDKYNYTQHRTIKVKPLMLRQVYIYIDFGVENNDKDLKFKVDDHVRIYKYQNIFEKGYIPS